MKRSFKRVVAVVSAFALLIAGISYVPQKVNADTSLTGDSAWQAWFSAGGTVTSTDASSEVVNGSIGGTWWNIQTWLADITFVKGYEYTGTFKVTAAKPKQFRVDKRVGDGIIFDGEVSVSDWTENEDGTYSCTYTGKTTQMTETSKFDLRVSFGYFDGTNGAVGNGGELDGWSANDTINVTISDFNLTRTAVGETETDPEVTTPADGYKALPSADTQVGPWILYSANNSWVTGEMQYKGGESLNDLSLKVINTSGTPGCWGMQIKYVLTGLTAGKNYKYTVNYKSNNAGKMFLKLEGVDNGNTFDGVAGDNTISNTFTAAGAVTMVFEISGFAAGSIIDFNGITVSEVSGETETSTEAPTEAPTTQPTGEANWVEIGGGDGNTKYYYDKANMTINEVVNIQQPGWSPEMGIYMNVTSGISAVSVNGNTENVAKIDGAGVIVYLSALTQEINEIEITHANGTGKIYVKKVGKAQPVKHAVTINGNKAAEVEEGGTYTLGDAQYGYYTDGKIYKPGTVLTITGDIALTSIDSLSVDMANGAAIKLSTPAGLKFQAKVSSNNEEAVKSDAIKEGMLITANDIYENNSSSLDLTSSYTMLNIVNEGWFDESAMTYCGAVANISEANYTRDFIARAYVTITYTDNTSVTVYSGMSQTRSVSYVASAVKAAGYPGIAASEIPVVDSFIK